MRFKARPRVGGRRALGRWRRGGSRRGRPLMGDRPRPPPVVEGGDEIGFSSWPEEEHGQGVHRGRLERARATESCAPGVVCESRAV